MKVFQRDLLGNKIEIQTGKAKKESKPVSAPPPKKEFKSITLNIGIDAKQAEAEAMLTHRVLQKRALNLSKLLKILKNEIAIKAGQKDAVTAVRDSLIRFYVLD
jgi:hypothetical protein